MLLNAGLVSSPVWETKTQAYMFIMLLPVTLFILSNFVYCCCLFSIVLLPQWEFLKQPSHPSVSLLWTCWGRAQSCSAPHVAGERKSISLSIHADENEKEQERRPGLSSWQLKVKKKRKRDWERESCVQTQSDWRKIKGDEETDVNEKDLNCLII